MLIDCRWEEIHRSWVVLPAIAMLEGPGIDDCGDAAPILLECGVPAVNRGVPRSAPFLTLDSFEH